ncbi:MAG: hypothetical protein JXA16_07340 [Bacteroidales bacterium]|nr:hypothetical protein [Bacteroidales bacterium]
MIFLLSNNINSQDFEISPATMNFNAEPGQTQTIPMNIINHSSQKSAFTVVLSDYIINKEGNKIIMPPASTEHSLVNWISINPPFFELNPNESRQVIVSIQAPVGDYSTKWAHINVRSTTEQTASLADKKLQTGMLVQGQIVVNAIQSPRSNVNYKMKITSLAENTNINDTIRTFTANIDNLGDKISDCKVTLLASDLSNAKEYVLQVIEFQVFPDSPRIIIMSFNKNALPKGTYSLAAILDYGPKANLEGTQMMITVD